MRKNDHVKRFGMFAAAAALLLMCAAGAWAQIDPGMHRSQYFASVGVARGQSARLTIVWPPGPCYPPDPCMASGPFNTTLSFYDANGNLVAQQVTALSPNRPATLNFTPTAFGGGGGAGRVQVRGVVTVDPDSNGDVPHIAPSIEVVNVDGSASNVLNPGSLVGFNPQPDPPGFPYFNFGFVTYGRGQTVRVNASYLDADGFPPDPCRITLSFYNGDGRLLAQTVQIVEVGKTASFDIPAGDLPMGARSRLRASVSVEPLAGGLIPCIMPSVEVFNNDTAKTALFYPGAMIDE